MRLTAIRGACLLAHSGAAIPRAQDYPTKPVRVVVPFPPGGINDTVGRLIATQLSTRLGKQFVVENRGGAGGVVGSEFAANAPKDGYTLLIVSIAHAVNPWLYKLPYDPIKSFTPIAAIVTAPNVIVVHPVAAGPFGEGTGRARQAEARRRAICLGRHRQLHASGRRDCSRSPPASISCTCRSRAPARR